MPEELKQEKPNIKDLTRILTTRLLPTKD